MLHATHCPHVQGIVEVPLRAAAAIDPMGAALRPEAGPQQEEAQLRRRGAYNHVFATLRQLAVGAGNTAAAAGAAGGAGGGPLKGLTSAEHAHFKATLLKVWRLRRGGDLICLPARTASAGGGGHEWVGSEVT